VRQRGAAVSRIAKDRRRRRQGDVAADRSAQGGNQRERAAVGRRADRRHERRPDADLETSGRDRRAPGCVQASAARRANADGRRHRARPEPDCRGPDEVDNRQRSARRDRKERLVLSAVFAASALRRVFQEAIMKPMCIGLLFLVAAGSAAAQDPLSGARELYASAAYEDALTTLTKLHSSDTAASNI